jgi:hypothetical protein
MSFLDDLTFLVQEKEEANAIHTRFANTPWMLPQGLPSIRALIIGVGNIGSWLALYASRSNINRIELFDHDKVELHNIGGQLYSPMHIDKPKVDAVKELLVMLSDYKDVTCVQEKYSYGTLLPTSSFDHVVFSCVDNMKARQDLFEEFMNFDALTLFIDGRSNAEHFQVFSVKKGDPKAIAAYRLELFEDDEVEDAPCNFKSTSHCGSQLASIMWANCLNHVANVALKKDLREVPFKIEVNLMNMLYDVTIL